MFVVTEAMDVGDFAGKWVKDLMGPRILTEILH